VAKEGINDKILEKMLRLQNQSINKIVDKTKGEKPFATEEVPNDVLIWAVNHTSPEDMMGLIQEFGEDNINELLDIVKMAENRRK